ncbi:unnamed protein product [Rotaria socialis]
MGSSSSQNISLQRDVVDNEHPSLPIPKLFYAWLDNSIDSIPTEVLDFQRKIQASLENKKLNIFDDEIDCEGFIREQSLIDKVIVIVNTIMAEFFVPRAHNLCQVACILIYYQTEDTTSQRRFGNSVDSFRKVKYIRMDQLVAAFDAFVARWQRNAIESFSIDLFLENRSDESEDRSASDINASYFYTQLLINTLIRLKYSSYDINEFAEACAKEYAADSAKLKEVQSIYNNYKPQDALCWYTKPTFLYAVLNQALRVRNGNLIPLYRFFIRDVYSQLVINQCKAPVRVYRGQLISKYELKRMRESKGRLIAMNSFLSTSLDRDSAKFFLGGVENTQTTREQNVIPVLFEIYADPVVASMTKKPFADITPFSHFDGAEEEILFMVGSIFRLHNVHKEVSMWIVDMTLSDDNEDQARTSFNYMIKSKNQEELQTDEPTFRTLGTLLLLLGCTDLSEKYIQRQLHEMNLLKTCATTETEDITHNFIIEQAKCHEILANVALDQGKYRLTIRTFNQALEIYTMIFKDTKDVFFAKIYMQLGSVYLLKSKPRRALKLFEAALSIYQQHYGDEHLSIANCYQSMSLACSHLRKHSKAHEYLMKGYEMHQRLKPEPGAGFLPTNHTLTGAEDPWYSVPFHHRQATSSQLNRKSSDSLVELQRTTTDAIDINNSDDDEIDDSWEMPCQPFMTPKMLYCETEDHQVVEIPLTTVRTILYECPRCEKCVRLRPMCSILKGTPCRKCIRKMICCC